MIDIKTISGELLLSVPILQDAVCHEELMVSDYVALSWNSDNNEELPAGAYIEFEGERYSLLEPYKPTMVTEGEFKYAPQFHSRVSAWDKQPACVYTYESDGVTVKTREFDWTIVGSPADAMQIIKQAIKNETGEEWHVKIAESLPASIEISSQTSSIKSVLASIADQCQTEYWVEKATNTLHLSKCEFGEEVALEVGSNIGVPSVMMGGNEYYTRYYALGSSRNITQGTAGVNGSVNKRLTLDPTAFPHGYKDVKGHFENGVFVSDLKLGEIFSKVVVFDDIYPSSDLEIYDVRARMKYRLDGDGKKIKIGGTDENPVYDQYSIWYFKIKDFSFNSDSLIEGLPLSVHFKSGRLSGQEFELIYHDKAKTENTNGDVGQFNVEVGDYEIKFKESSGVIIPDIAYIIPQSGDKVTLYNIEMPKEYTSSAQQRLLEALDKHIEKEHSDSNTYEFSSNPVAFYESELTLSVGQKVSFVNGEKTLETRTLMVERKLDYPCEQKIRIGSDIIKGSTKELRENVESLNHNVDVLAAFNDLSKSIQDSYGRNQALVNEAISSLLGIWALDSEGNLVTDKQVVIKNNLIVEQDTSSGGAGQDTPAEGTVTGIEVNGTPYEPNTQGVIDLSDAFKAIDVSDQLKAYYTQTQTDSAISTAIANLINGAPTTLDTLKEIADALAENEDVVDALEEAIGKKADNTTVTALTERVKTAEDAISDNAGNIKKNFDAIEALTTRVKAEEDITTTYKSWWDDLKSLIVKDGTNNIKIKGNLIVTGDTASGGDGQDTPASGTVTGIKVGPLSTDILTPNNAGIIDMVSVLSSIDVSDQLTAYAKTEDVNAALLTKQDAISDLATIRSGAALGATALQKITKDMVDSVLGSTTAGNANRFLMSTGSTSVWAAISKTMVTDALGYTPLSTGGGTISGPIKINTAGTDIFFSVLQEGTNKAAFGWEVYLGAYIYNYKGYVLGIKDNGTPYFGTSSAHQTLIHSGNYSTQIGDYYLKSSGGTLTGKLTTGQRIQLKGSIFEMTQADGTEGIMLWNGQSSGDGVKNLMIYDGSAWRKTIHSGNIGSQSVTSAQKLVDASTGATRISVDSNSYIYLTSRIHWGDGDWYSIGSYTETSGVPPFGRYIFYSGHIFKTASGEAMRINSSGNVVFAHDIILNHIVIDGSNDIYSDNGLYIQPFGGGEVNINYLGTNTIINQVSGNVGIGTTSPAYKLDVIGKFRASDNVIIGSSSYEEGRLRVVGKNGDTYVMSVCDYDGWTKFAVFNNGNTEVYGNLVVSGDTSSGSDIRFKDIIKNKTLKIADIAKAPLFTFKWNDREDDTIHLGSSAQYWEKVTPWLVKGTDFKTLDYSTLGVAMGISLAKKAVNHEERIKALEKENKALKEEIRRITYGS